MSAHIRLKRIGKTKRPYYRVVVLDSRLPRDGACLETLGYYQPVEKDSGFKVDLAKYDEWMQKGAKPSLVVRDLVKKMRKIG